MSTTVTLQPTQYDTFIASNAPTTNFSTGTALYIGDVSVVASAAYRTLLKFDLSSIPANAVILSATLSLFEWSANDTASVGTWSAALRRLLVSWDNSNTTWNNRASGTPWNTAGAGGSGTDIAAATSATLTLDATPAGTFVAWSGSQLVDDIQNMIDGVWQNYGWLLYAPSAEYRGASPIATNAFRSGNYATSSARPKLAVTYILGSPATLLDSKHGWQLEIDGTDRYRNVEKGSLSWTENEAGEIGTLRATLRETGASLGIVEWQEVVLKDGNSAVWGGYITNAIPLADRMGNSNRLTWEISAESYATILNRSRRVRKVYYNVDPGDILVDLFDQALDPDSDPPNQAEFDTSTYVTTGSWDNQFTFAVDGEKLTDVLDRLALLAGYVWWIDADKAVHFGAASASTAPFGIKLADDADYSSFFPPIANSVNARIDATEIRNQITVHGGTKVSATQTETYYGDGSQLVFPVTHAPIVEIVSISVGGVMQAFGTDWYHSFDDYDCLVNYSHGTVRWDTGNAPPNLDAVIIRYRYGQQVVVRVSDATSISYYGRIFSYEIVDRSIASEAAATAVANAMLADYAYGTLVGSFDVDRLGIHAGQRVQIEHTALGLTGYYQARQVATVLRPGGLVRCSVRFGGRRMRLTGTLGGNLSGGSVTPSGKPSDTPILAGRSGGASLAKDQYGLQMTVPDYGSSERDTSGGAATESYQIRFRNSSDVVLHTLEAWSDQNALGADREVFNLNGTTLTKFGYLLLQMIAKKEAYVRLGATGGYEEAGQQTASVHIYAYRKDGLWDHSRVYLDADTVRVKTYTGGSEPDPGTDSLPDGLLVYTDGTWNPGSGEGLYIYINAAWRPLAVVENARQYLDNSIDLEGNHLYNVGNLDLEPGGTKTANFNAGSETWYAVNTASGNITATLPQLSTIEPGRVYIFVKVTSDSNQMIVDGYSSETINGATTQSTTTQWGVIRVIARNTDWLMW